MAYSVQRQIECASIRLHESKISARRLSGSSAEKNELRGVSTAIDEVRKQRLRTRSSRAFQRNRSRRNDEGFGGCALIVAGAQTDNRNSRSRCRDAEHSFQRIRNRPETLSK